MTTNRRGLFRRGRHDGGASAVEYALILAGVALVGVATLFLLGRTVKGAFIAAQNQTASQPSGVLPSVSGTNTAAATPTSSTSIAPSPSSSSPSAPSASPTTTVGTIKKDARQDKKTTLVDLKLEDEADLTDESATLTPPTAGTTVKWDGDKLEIDVGKNTPIGTVITVTYSYQIDGVSYTGTVTVTVTKKN